MSERAVARVAAREEVAFALRLAAAVLCSARSKRLPLGACSRVDGCYWRIGSRRPCDSGAPLLESVTVCEGDSPIEQNH
jgi:hypothetical protein